jgi:hypothetical protein
MAIVQQSDFVGEYKVSTSRFTELGWYINRYEKLFLLKMMGKNLYDLFVADLTPTTPQVPQSPRFENIFYPFDKLPSSDEILISEGIKTMLVQFVYFYYTRNSSLQNSIVGVVKSSNENSILSHETNIVEVYNRAVSNYCNIQSYLHQDDLVTYPEFGYADYLSYSSGI